MKDYKVKRIDIYEPADKSLIFYCKKYFSFPERKIGGKTVDNTLMIYGRRLPVMERDKQVIVVIRTFGGDKYGYVCTVGTSTSTRLIIILKPKKVPQKTIRARQTATDEQIIVKPKYKALEKNEKIGKIKKIEIFETDNKTLIMSHTRNFSFPEKDVNGKVVDNMLMIKGKNMPVLAKGSLVNVLIHTRNNERYNYFCQVELSTHMQINIMLQTERARKLEEQRRFYKVQAEINCRVTELMRGEEVSSYNPPVFGKILDINLGGIFVSVVSADEYENGDILTVALTLDENKLELMSKILRVQKDPDGEIKGYGCSFVRITARDEEIISHYVNNLQIEARRAEKDREPD